MADLFGAGDGSFVGPTNQLGLPTTGTAAIYYDNNPGQGWQTYVNQLGGENTGLGRYAARHFNEAYAQFLQQASSHPDMNFATWLGQYAARGQGGPMQQQYALASPFARDPYNTPQWAATRYLG